MNTLGTEGVVGDDVEDVLRFEPELEILFAEAAEGLGKGCIRLPNMVLTEEVTALVEESAASGTKNYAPTP